MTIKDVLSTLRELKNKHADKSEALNYAIEFIRKHNQENVLKYKDYTVTAFFSEKDRMLYGKAINPKNPKYIVLVNGNSVQSFIEDFHFSIDTIEKIQKNNFEFGIDIVEMVDENINNTEEVEVVEQNNTVQEEINNDIEITENNESNQEYTENNREDNAS